MAKLQIIHFNDVYRVQPFKLDPKSPETIDVTQFGAMLDGIRNSWADRQDGQKDGLVLFSGDLFSPSVESSVTRGSHMVPVINELAPDVSLTGNHDFDFGYPHLTQLIRNTKFPWLLSNVVDTTTHRVPEHLHEYYIFERAGVQIGVIGLIENWVGEIADWPAHFEYRDMAEVGIALSKRLRGELGCDIVIALTHARVPNDVALAKVLGALSPPAQKERDIANTHGVDLILGGHDHLYYVSRGISAWEGYDTTQDVLGAEDDRGDVLIIKSGTDFRDLSSFELELEPTSAGSIRRKVIKRIVGIHHETKPGSPSSERMKELLKDMLASVSSSLKVPVCRSAGTLDVRSQFIRTAESAAGNWFADIACHAYDDALCVKDNGGIDAVFMCAGTFRGDSVYGPGEITLGDILQILPWEDPFVLLEVDGEVIWATLESALSKWPAQEGRFPIIAGLKVEWDSRRKPYERVLGVRLLKRRAGNTAPGPYEEIDVPRQGARKYVLITREWLAQGNDGFTMLKGQKYLVDDETGQLFSALVRKHLLEREQSGSANEALGDAAEANLPTIHPQVDGRLKDVGRS